MSLMVDEESIAESLSVPLDVVKGVISGDVNDDALKHFNPALNKEVSLVEKRILTRGKVLIVVQHSPLAARMGQCLAQLQATAVIDLEPYPTTPIYCGMNIADIPQYVNFLWDTELEKKEYQKNLFVYLMPPDSNNWGAVKEICKVFPNVIINCSLDAWQSLAPVADIIYIPQAQNTAGIYQIHQMFVGDKTYEEKAQIVWIKGEKSLQQSQCLSVIRKFTNIQVAGSIPEMFLDIEADKNLVYTSKLLQTIYPELKSGVSLKGFLRGKGIGSIAK